jgi:hypothetical protein
MTDTRYLTLVTLLHRRSREGKIAWQETKEDGVYQATFGNLTLEVRAQSDRDYPEAPDYFVRILNDQGRLVEEFSNAELRELNREPSESYQLLQELYTSARRTAMGVEEALHNLLEELKGDDLPF